MCGRQGTGGRVARRFRGTVARGTVARGGIRFITYQNLTSRYEIYDVSAKIIGRSDSPYMGG
eukprot:2316257-Pleurochrysis_carterae.AAC.1